MDKTVMFHVAFGWLWVIFILLFILKLAVFPGLSWWWVTAPLWGSFSVVVFLVTLAKLLDGLASFIESRQ